VFLAIGLKMISVVIAKENKEVIMKGKAVSLRDKIKILMEFPSVAKFLFSDEEHLKNYAKVRNFINSVRRRFEYSDKTNDCDILRALNEAYKTIKE
jgi:hypothetical protein